MIKRIKWVGHESLGDLDLSFVKDDGSAYNTIIFAGENGTGKTTILETLSSFLSGEQIFPFDFIDYQASGQDFRITLLDGPQTMMQSSFHSRQNLKTGETVQVTSYKYSNPNRYQNDPNDLRSYGYAYTKARSGFTTSQIRTATTQQLDATKYESDEEDDFTRIKQLLVDISVQDASEWMRLSEAGGITDTTFEIFNRTSKTHRFSSAFNTFFDNLEYERIDNENPDEKRVVFKKHGREIGIDQLSTGEKQVVFRGAHLLRNVNAIKDGIVLIDEPELSMHPTWQKKILSYYRQLFTRDERQSVQMLIATHSEYVVNAALEDPDNVLIIALEDDNGTIRGRRITAPKALPKITAAETNYIAFNIASIDYHIELYAYLQSKTGSHNVKQCDDYILNSSQYVRTKHEKLDASNRTTCRTLPSYIRNAIDHPESGRKFTETELRTSIDLLIQLCK